MTHDVKLPLSLLKFNKVNFFFLVCVFTFFFMGVPRESMVVVLYKRFEVDKPLYGVRIKEYDNKSYLSFDL